MIEVANLVKSYGPKLAVNDISFKVTEGETVGFLGPNGAGKTTTLNILTGYISATSGSAKISGIDILGEPIKAKSMIGYMPEHPPLYMDMLVSEYLDFMFELKAKNYKAKPRNKHLSEICDMVGISDVRHRMIKNLSKGYKQRVGLAQSLVGDPPVLILDEPTVGLDPQQIIEILNVIKELGKKRTIILSSHILPEVQAVCERVLVISHGDIVADDTPGKLSDMLSGERKLHIRIAGPKEQVLPLLRRTDGVMNAVALDEKERGAWDYSVESRPNLDIRKPLFQALAQGGFPILMLKPEDMTLEEIFLKLVSGEAQPIKQPRENKRNKTSAAPAPPEKESKKPDKKTTDGSGSNDEFFEEDE